MGLRETLKTRLIGDEGEIYDAAGNASYPDFPDQETQKAERRARPWWTFW